MAGPPQQGTRRPNTTRPSGPPDWWAFLRPYTLCCDEPVIATRTHKSRRRVQSVTEDLRGQGVDRVLQVRVGDVLQTGRNAQKWREKLPAEFERGDVADE